MSTPSVFRSDGWVKSAVGPAVPGSQIYVCLQPANVGSLPPDPLANIFSDPNGLVPITQPILTDGFGHYDFYIAPGTYTIVVGLGGRTQQVYPDQSIGLGTGGGGSTLLLQCNGEDNADQEKLNLFSSDGTVIVIDAGDGNVDLQSTGIPAGGTTGQVLEKDSDTDYDVSWHTPAGGSSALLYDSGGTLLISQKIQVGVSTLDGSGNMDVPINVDFSGATPSAMATSRTSTGAMWATVSGSTATFHGNPGDSFTYMIFAFANPA